MKRRQDTNCMSNWGLVVESFKMEDVSYKGNKERNNRK